MIERHHRMNTCDTCKYAHCAQHSPWITCLNENLSSEDGLRDCGLEATGVEEGIIAPRVGPKFGCIHHEPKPV